MDQRWACLHWMEMMAITIFQELVFSTTLHFQLDRAHRHRGSQKYQIQSHFSKYPKPLAPMEKRVVV